MLTWPKQNGAPPLFATPRNPRLKSEGTAVAAVARSLGTPFIPWQQYTADVAGERRPDGSYEYEIVIVSVPRQTGKTTEIRAVGTHRAAVLGRDVFYTAQTGKDARARWMDLVNIVQKSPLWGPRVKVTLRGGAECATFLGNAGFHVFAPTPESLHGYTPPTVFLDEVFALTGAEGELLMGAIGPAQITIRDKQIWIVSTAGTAESIFLHDWIERALGGMARVALFLWGAADGDDVYDLATIERFHPGVGFMLNDKVLSASDVLDNANKMSRAEYERAFGNRRTLTSNNLIPTATWRELAPPEGYELAAPLDTREVTLGYAVAHDRRSAAILAAWPLEDGRVGLKIVQADQGTAWLPDAVAALSRSWRPRSIRTVRHGPTLAATETIRDDLGVDVDELVDQRYSAATAAFLSGVDDELILHDGGGALELSVTGLATRSSGPDGKAFSGELSAGDSAPGIAATVAFSGADTRNVSRPVLSFG